MVIAVVLRHCSGRLYLWARGPVRISSPKYLGTLKGPPPHQNNNVCTLAIVELDWGLYELEKGGCTNKIAGVVRISVTLIFTVWVPEITGNADKSAMPWNVKF